MTEPVELDFYFSPGCQWAWRTALWIRQVRALRPLNVSWKILSLFLVNRGHDPQADAHAAGYRAEKLLVAARRQHGNDGMERLYMALGDAYHGRKETKSDELLLACLRQAGLPEELQQLAQSDPSIEDELTAEHQHAVDAYRAFGVPTLHLKDTDMGFFGPVVDPVPLGEQALELWDHVHWMLRQPYLWEYKRERGYRPQPQPFIEASAAAAAGSR